MGITTKLYVNYFYLIKISRLINILNIICTSFTKFTSFTSFKKRFYDHDYDMSLTKFVTTFLLPARFPRF